MTTNNHDKFSKWVELLAWDLNMANDHYKLFVRLDKSIDNYKTELNQSPWFWNLTMNAHKQVIAFRLCRIFDQRKATLSLPNLLKHIKNNKHDIFTSDKQPNSSQLVADMKTVDGKVNRKVGNLVFWRNNLFAHLGPEHLEDWKKVEEKYPLTPYVPELIATGYEILNRYRMLFCNSEHSRKGIGEDDCEGMLKLLRLGLRVQQNRSAD
jgi:hypothetical protein